MRAFHESRRLSNQTSTRSARVSLSTTKTKNQTTKNVRERRESAGENAIVRKKKLPWMTKIWISLGRQTLNGSAKLQHRYTYLGITG